MSEETLFQWSKDYHIGHQQIDGEHKYLFSLLQMLTDAVIRGEDDKDVILDALTQLLEYTQTHFRNEEELMRRHQYEDYEKHRENHDKLITQVEDLLDEFQEGEPVLSLEVMLFLKDWLKNHIFNDDLLLAQLIK